MNTAITVKQLRTSLPELVARVRKGMRFTVFYRGRAAFQIVPVDAVTATARPLVDDPLFHASAVGRSTDGLCAADHDAELRRR
jgi:antitoxin (DNA-binding transcriptional repressor) of toxin-antitoxin stability system